MSGGGVPSMGEVTQPVREGARAPGRTLVRPVAREADLDLLDRLESHDLLPAFRQQMKDLRADLFSKVKTKQLFGNQISAHTLLSLASSYVDDMNRRKLPDIRKAWNSSEGRVIGDVYENAWYTYRSGLEHTCSKMEDIYLYECVHAAGVTKDLEIGAKKEIVCFVDTSHFKKIASMTSSLK